VDRVIVAAYLTAYAFVRVSFSGAKFMWGEYLNDRKIYLLLCN